MAVALAQAIATAASVGSRVTTLAPLLGGAPSGSDRVIICITWDKNPAGGASNNVTIVSVSGMVALGPVFTSGQLQQAFYSALSSGPQNPTVTFSSATYATAALCDFSGCLSVAFVSASFGSYGTNSVIGNTPISWAPLTGDLPFGFFSSRDAASAVVQPTWTELANLNHVAGQFAQMEVQSGPSAGSSPSNETASVTWSSLGGSDTTNISTLFIASAQAPYELISQLGFEAAGSDTANVRVSQLGLETIGTDTANVRVSQLGLELVGTDTANVRISQIGFELIVPAVATRRRNPGVQLI